MEILGGLALDEDGVRANVENGGHREHVGFDDVLERGHERLVACELLVPPAVGGREGGAHEHLVHGRVELHPRETLREDASVLREKRREVWVLEVADPVRYAEVAEVDNRVDVEALQATESLVCEVIIVAVVSKPGSVDRRAIAQEADIEIPQQRKVCFPMLVMTARLQLIDPNAAILNRGVAILNAGREHEPMHCHRITPGYCAGGGERWSRASQRHAAPRECTSLPGWREARLLL